MSERDIQRIAVERPLRNQEPQHDQDRDDNPDQVHAAIDAWNTNRSTTRRPAVVPTAKLTAKIGGRWRTIMDDYGIAVSAIQLRQTSVDECGCQVRGLQNRLRGAVEASWVGSIPIHPRQFRR